MVKASNSKVFFRIFPTENMTWDHVKILNDHKTVYIRCLQELGNTASKYQVPTFWSFKTDHVFYNESQEQIHQRVTREIVDTVFDGHSAIIMAFGQTGTGKSLSVTGLRQSYDDRGMLLRIISELFQSKKVVAGARNMKISIQVSYIELSKNCISDLLRKYPENLVASLKDISRVRVRTEEEAMRLAFLGEARKEFHREASYASNEGSGIFTFHVSMKYKNSCNPMVIQSKLHVIDLAGADTAGNFSCLFRDPLEVGNSNLAKTQLEQFLLVLSSKIPDKIRVKQRLNNMIYYLGDSLKSAKLLRFVGHIRISRDDLLITISMLRFGQLIAGYRPAKICQRGSGDVTADKIRQLETQLEKMKLENMYNTLLMNRKAEKIVSKDRYGQMERTIADYLQNKVSKVTLMNVCDIEIALEIMKRLYLLKEVVGDDKSVETASLMSRGGTIGAGKTTKSGSKRASGGEASHKPISPDVSLAKTGSQSNKSISNRSRDSLVNKSRKEKTPINVPRSVIEFTNPTLTSKRHSAQSFTKGSTTSTRKKSSSNSIIKLSLRSKTKIGDLIPDTIVPDHAEAWSQYLIDRAEPHNNLMDLYKLHEQGTKEAHKNYLDELQKLHDSLAEVERRKSDLFLAKMTLEYEQVKEVLGEDEDLMNPCPDIDVKCQELLKEAEVQLCEQQELVLKCQGELNVHIGAIQEITKDIKKNYECYFKEKYHVPPAEDLKLNTPEGSDLIPIDPTQPIIVARDVTEVEKVLAVTKDPYEIEKERFEKLQNLFLQEKKRVDAFKCKEHKWTFH